MINFSDLLETDPQVFSGLADEWSSLADTVSGHGDALRSKVAEPVANGQQWSGDAGSTAGRHVAQVQDEVSTHASNLRRVSSVLRESAGNFAKARAQAVQIRQQAGQYGLTVDSTGAVSADPSAPAASNTSPQAAQVIGNKLNIVVRWANEADQKAAAAIRSLHPRGPEQLGTLQQRVTPAMVANPDTTIPAAGTDPASVKRWWDGLPQATQKQLADQNPQQIGSLDGVPCAVRDYANRELLGQLMLTTTDPTKLAGLQALQTQLGPSNGPFPTQDVPVNLGSTPPPKYLLGVDTNNAGHAIVASNNPDASHHVATVVPGVTTKLDSHSVNEYTQAADRLVGAAQAKDGQQDTSVIAWMNYNAPSDAVSVDAASSADAKEGAPLLANFQNGLHATHDPSDTPHVTLIGHSYGSCVVGQASKLSGGLHSDDVVAIGSPGMDVDSAGDLGVPSGHVWAAKAANDIIGVADDTEVHDTDPTYQGVLGTGLGSFGAKVFDAGEGVVNPIDSHTSYFDQNSPALGNMADIVTGNYDAVSHPSWYEQSPW